MLEVILALALGLGIGKLSKGHKTLMSLSSRFSTLGLLAMLFCMGLSIGANQEVLADLPSLGWQAFLLALVSAGGSMLCCLPLARFLKKRQTRIEQEL